MPLRLSSSSSSSSLLLLTSIPLVLSNNDAFDIAGDFSTASLPSSPCPPSNKWLKARCSRCCSSSKALKEKAFADLPVTSSMEEGTGNICALAGRFAGIASNSSKSSVVAPS
jgi:hypothetical protein